jgi:hypothetical protein
MQRTRRADAAGLLSRWPMNVGRRDDQAATSAEVSPVRPIDGAGPS